MRQPCPKSCPSAKEPFECYTIEHYSAGESYVIEPSELNHLVFVMQGSCVITSEESTRSVAEQGTFFFCYHCGHYELTMESDVEFVVARFARPGAACDIASLMQYSKSLPGFEYHFTTVPINEQLSNMLSLVKTFVNDGIPCAHMHSSMLEMLFVVFRFYYDVEVLANLFFNLFDHAVSFRTMVEGNRTKARNLNHLAELCGYDINTFNVVFRRHYPGYTPGVWMQIQRKDEVLADLTDTDAPIYYISKKFGFSSSSHLGEYCKKYLGDTPTKLRAKYRKK